jgi:hypothetical protein
VAQPAGVKGAAQRCPPANGPDVDDFSDAGLSEREGTGQSPVFADFRNEAQRWSPREVLDEGGQREDVGSSYEGGRNESDVGTCGDEVFAKRMESVAVNEVEKCTGGDLNLSALTRSKPSPDARS